MTTAMADITTFTEFPEDDDLEARGLKALKVKA
jgi:hypothetical protein